MTEEKQYQFVEPHIPKILKKQSTKDYIRNKCIDENVSVSDLAKELDVTPWHIRQVLSSKI